MQSPSVVFVSVPTPHPCSEVLPWIPSTIDCGVKMCKRSKLSPPQDGCGWGIYDSSRNLVKTLSIMKVQYYYQLPGTDSTLELQQPKDSTLNLSGIGEINTGTSRSHTFPSSG